MTILIVEDSSLELQRITRMVREAVPEAQILSTGDSLEAEDWIRQQKLRPDIAFLDIEMPSPSGIELAQELTSQAPRVNIIFTTAYADYMPQAFAMYASGYLLKPFSAKDIRDQLEHLRYPLPRSVAGYYARMWGNFDFFYQGKPVVFSLARSKEALAYLIDRQGASVTKRELFSILFEDEEYSPAKQDHMKKIMHALSESLAKTGGGNILIHTRNSYAVDMSLIATDLSEPDVGNNQTYMEQYSWSEYRYL